MNWYLVEGLNPEPWTASLASVGRKGGHNYVQFYKAEPLRLYQESLKQMLVEQNPQAVDIPGDIQLWFYFWRQLTLNEMFEGKNRRTHVADATNLQKATEDALQGILFQNDRNVQHIRSSIVEQGQDTVPRILIGVAPFYPDAEDLRDAAVLAATMSQPIEAQENSNIRRFNVEEVF